MKKIKLKICGYDERDDFSYGAFLLKILRRYYDVEMSENPDFLFYNESTYEYLKYDCIRIFFTGENVTPNFNFCDYAIGFDWMDFGDRFYRLPLYLVTVFYSEKEVELAGNLDFKNVDQFTMKDLQKKDGFCSFVYSNYLAAPERQIFFDMLNKYKPVNSGGRYLNNVGGRVDNKLEFEMKHKFSIAFENTSRTGYTTEKLVGSLAARTIPVYWGNPHVGREFNTRRFINCHEYKSFDEVIERIKEIDNDDSLYLNIINEPVIVPGYNFQDVRSNFESFLRHIFDQPAESARRRVLNSVRVHNLEIIEKNSEKFVIRRSIIRKVIALIYKPFKRLKIMEDVKVSVFKKIKR